VANGKKAFTKMNVKRAIEKVLTANARKGAKARGREKAHYTSVFLGAWEAAQSIGLTCGCSKQVHSGLDLCKCTEHGEGIAGIGKYTLDGANCRDKAGNFVPIARCNPPWARGKNVHIEIVEKTKTGKKRRRALS
jgi:hypothetical protein